MNPIFALWWFMHRGLIDPEIAARLSKGQRRLVWKQATSRANRNWPFKGSRWILPLVIGVGMATLGLGPLRWVFQYARQFAGPFGPLLVGYSCGLGIAITMWWLSRRLIEKSIYRNLREFNFDVCPQCGYWLRGLSADIEKCPECGKAREPMPNAASSS